MSDSGGIQQPWSPGGQPAQNPGWGQQPTQGPPPAAGGGYGPPPGAPPASPPGAASGAQPQGGYGAPGAAPSWNQPGVVAAPKPGLKVEFMTFPWLLAAVGILVGFVVLVLGNIIGTFQKHIPGGGKARVTTLFGFGQPNAAIALLVAIALVVLAPKVLQDKGELAPSRRFVIDGVLVGSLLIALGAVVDIIVDFTYYSASFSAATNDLLTRVAAIMVALGAAYWALATRAKTPRAAVAAPPTPPWGQTGSGPGAPPTTGFQPGQYPPQGGYPPQAGGYPPPGS
jgi:hypothetical protein